MANLPQGQQDSAIYWVRNAEPVTAVINDQSDPNYVGAIGGDDGITGLDSPSIRENAQNLVEGHGGVHGPFWAGRRPVVADVEVYDPTIAGREAKLDLLSRAILNQMGQDGKLIWFPGDPSVVATTRENLIKNPSYEYDTTSAAPSLAGDFSDGAWTGKTFTVEAANPSSGTKSARWRATKDATATSRAITITADGLGTSASPVVGGAVYSARVNVFINNALAGGTAFSLGIAWYDSNGTGLGTTSGTALSPIGANGAQAPTVVGATAPANAAYAQLVFTGASTGSGDVVDLYFDGWQLVREATVGAYFDGDSANSSWLGLRGASTSVNRPNGRQLTTRVQLEPRIAGKGWKKDVQVPLVAADPRMYSTVIYEATAVSGTPVTIENKGRAESPPVSIRINGPGTSPTISVQSNGVTRSMVFTGLTLGAGAYIDINPQLGTIVDNTAADKRGSLIFASSTWWGIMPGPTNVVSISWVSGNTAASTVRVRWADAWL